MKAKIILTSALAVIASSLVLLERGCHSNRSNEKNAVLTTEEEATGFRNNMTISEKTVTKTDNRDRTIQEAIYLERLENTQEGPIVSCFGRSVASVTDGNGANYVKNKNGDIIFRSEGNIGNLRQSPDEKKLVIFSYPNWGIYQIEEGIAKKCEDKLPEIGDVEWLWHGNSKLLGILQIYEKEKRPHMENEFVINTKLYLYDIETKTTKSIAWPEVTLLDGQFIRMDGVLATGQIELSIVTSDNYFNPKQYIRRLGQYKLVH